MTISVFNVAIGLSINHIRDSLNEINRFKLVQMIQLNHDIEDSFIFASKILHRLRLSTWIDPVKCVILLDKSEAFNCRLTDRSSNVFKRRKGDWTSNLNYSKANETSKDFLNVYWDEENATEVVGSIPARILDAARPIIEERKERLKLEKEIEIKIEDPKEKPPNNEYTNLYWQPYNYSVSENEYEIVEDNSAKQPTNVASGGILRSMRESLLRELRRDLTKLTRYQNYSNVFRTVLFHNNFNIF